MQAACSRDQDGSQRKEGREDQCEKSAKRSPSCSPVRLLCGAAAAVQWRRHRCEKVKVNRVKEATKILTDDADDLAEDSR